MAFPLFAYHPSFFGDTDEKTTYDAIFSIHPILGLWVEATSRVLKEGFFQAKPWKLVAPDGYGNVVAPSPDMLAQITMHGEVYHHYVGVVSRLRSLEDSSDGDSFDDEAYQKMATTKIRKQNSKRRK